MKKAIPILILCALILGGCGIGANDTTHRIVKPRRFELTGKMDVNTVLAVTGAKPIKNPTGEITSLNIYMDGEVESFDRLFAMHGITWPYGRNAFYVMSSRKGSETKLTAEGIVAEDKGYYRGWWDTLFNTLIGIGLIGGLVWLAAYIYPPTRPGAVAFGSALLNWIKPKAKPAEPTAKEKE